VQLLWKNQRHDNVIQFRHVKNRKYEVMKIDTNQCDLNQDFPDED